MGNLARYALCITAATVLLAACGGPPPPISLPGVIPQSSALAARPDSTYNYKVVYSFSGGSNGSFPAAPLIEVKRKLYGTTEYAGVAGCYTRLGCGTVYSLRLDGRQKVLYAFTGDPDGVSPLGGLVDVGGTLYGTTSFGGKEACPYGFSSSYYSCGTVFSVTPSGLEKVLYRFGYPPDGNTPAAGLLDVNGTLYGTTQNGGAHYKCAQGCGTAFSVTPSGTETVLHNFGKGTDGHYPVASLIEAKGKLYGTTSEGGIYSQGGGTVFRLTLSGREKVLHSFGNGTDGSHPVAGLIDVGGTLYGTTEYGGPYACLTPYTHCGTVFSITPSGAEKVLHSFDGGIGDGADPVASLINVKGTLYGTTEYGGPYCEGGGCGTIFSITPSGTEKVLHSFGSGTDGSHPAAALIDVNGTLYGTTTGGGAYNRGTVFALTP